MLSALALQALLAAAPQEPDEHPFVDLYTAGLPALLADGKDAGLLQLASVASNAASRAIAESDEDMRLLADLVEQLLGRPARLRIADNPAHIGEDAVPIRTQLELHALPADTRAAMIAELDRLMDDESGAPERVEIADGLYERAAGGLRMVYGRSGEDGLWTLGAPLPTGVPEHGLPLGATPLIVAHVEPENFLRNFLGGFFFIFFPAQVELPNWWHVLFGGLEVHAAYGTDDARGHASLRLVQMGRAAEENGLLAERELTSADLALVPGDARFAALWALRPGGVLEAVSLVVDEELLQPDLVRALDGAALRADEWLGDVGGAYLADSTGGLDVTALIVFHELREGVQADEVFATFDALFADAWEGLRLTRRRSGEAELLSLQFPGLPVPVEPTLAVANGRLWFALHPGTLLAALAGSSTTLESRHEAVDALESGGLGFVLLDTPALAPRGGALLGLGLSAAANALRGVTEVPAGVWVPPTAELVAGARPLVLTLGRRGDDLVGVGTLDRSLAVNLAGVAGLLDHQALSWLVGIYALRSSGSRAMAFGMGSAAQDDFVFRVDGQEVVEIHATIEQAPPEAIEDPPEGPVVERGWAEVARAEADLAALEDALTLYALRNGGEHPDDLSVLVTPDENGQRYLDLEAVPTDPWGNAYVYVPPTGSERRDLYSLGADGEPGGTGLDADLRRPKR